MTVMSETFRVTLQPSGDSFEAAADETLLRSGLAAGLALPWSCRTGTCRTCISRLLSGRIEHTVPWPGLSSEEKAEGFILPCVAQPRSDCTVRPGSA